MKTDVSIQNANESDKKFWDSVVGHPLQSWAWGEFRKAMGIDVVRLGRYDGKTLTQGLQLTFHQIPYLPFTIGYSPKGPLPSDNMVKELMSLGKKNRAVFIQLEPNIVLTNNHEPITNNAIIRSNHPLFTKYTFVLDLTKPEEELLGEMHSKTRYNIRVAQKHNVVVREDNSWEAFDAYLKLMGETTHRQAYYAHSREYHQKMWEIMHGAGVAHLFTATYQKKILAAWVLFAWKDTLYYPYGASSREHREVMAPTLMLWETALWGKQQGLKQFDLWGALGPSPDQNDPWFGFHRFKEGFNPRLVEFIGSYDLVLQPQVYKLYKITDRLRWSILKLIK